MKGVKNVGGKVYEDIEKITEKFKKDIVNRTSKLLHNLHEDKPEKETLKKMIT